MKKLMKIVMILLTVCMLGTTVLPVSSFAEEDILSNQQDETPEDDGWLKLSTRAISFGQKTQNRQDVYYKTFDVENTDMEEHTIGWSISDPDEIWTVDSPTDLDLEPGETVTFSVLPRTDEVGSFDGCITIAAFDEDYNTLESKTVYLSVTVNEDQSWVESVIVTPSHTDVTKGGSVNFIAEVCCGGDASTDVEWSVMGNDSANTIISDNGELIVASDETSDELTITASSVEDPSILGYADVTIDPNQYTINAYADPYEGGSIAGEGTYNENDTVTLTALPSNGFSFDGWYDGDSYITDDKHLTVTVTGNKDYTACFTRNAVRVTVNVNNARGGSVSESQTIEYGGSIDLNATPNEHYIFDGWYEGSTLISKDAQTTLTDVTYDRTITAAFKQNDFWVTAAVAPENGGTFTGEGFYGYDQKAILIATPADGYEFVSWVLNGTEVSKEATYIINNVEEDTCLTVVFKKKDISVKMYNVTASAQEGGTITPSGKIALAEGTNLQFTIVPKEGYVISDVKVDGTSVGAVSTYTLKSLTADHTVNAEFKKQTVTPDSAKEQKQQDQESIDKAEDDEVVNGDTQEYMDYDTGVYAEAGITESKAREMIEAGEDKSLMETALYLGYLKVTVNNEYSDEVFETASKSYYDMLSVPNIADVIDNLITEDEKIAMFYGTCPITINLSITSDNDITEATKASLEKQAKGTIEQYIDISLIKDVNGVSTLVKDLDPEMEIIVNMPESCNNEHYVLRKTNDSIESLSASTSDNSVTFKTGSTGTFAIVSQKSGSSNSLLTGILIGAGVVLIGAVAALFVLHGKSKK